MRIVSLNANGVRSAFRKGFEEWVNNQNLDIVCLQEIKSQEIPSVSPLLGGGLTSSYYISVNPAAKKGYSGVAVLSKGKPITVKKELGLKRFDNEGRFLELQFPKFCLINVYMPHGARDKKNLDYKLEAYKKLISRLQKISHQNIIMTGDFNIAHHEIDLARPKENIRNIMFTPEERAQLDQIIKFGFDDTFRLFSQEGGNYSWWPYMKSARDNNIGWRLDYIFSSKNLASKVKRAFIEKGVFFSDHCPVGVEVTF